MANYLPSTAALQSFEAVARHLSFTRAAKELNVTQTAVSHRMKQLEALLDVELFVRSPEGIRLTEDGRQYLQLIRPALSEISIATDRVSHQHRTPRLRLHCLSTFLMRRLMPNLSDFQAAHPEIEIRLTPMNNMENLGRTDFDVAIWYGAGDWPGYQSYRLGETEIFPVCSPTLLEKNPLETPADLEHHTIIRVSSPLVVDDWPAWLDRAGASDVRFGSELRCDGTIVSIEAAICGLGVFAGRSEMVESGIANGSLVEPFNVRLESPLAYYLLVPEDKADTKTINTFRTWALETFRDKGTE